jgi:hypothetical protein
MEIGFLQLAHFPPNAMYERMGMFWYHLMGALQFGQCEAGFTTLSLRGRRQMQTFRKLAMQAPIQKLKKPNMQK